MPAVGGTAAEYLQAEKNTVKKTEQRTYVSTYVLLHVFGVELYFTSSVVV